jgi:hypothetical protein
MSNIQAMTHVEWIIAEMAKEAIELVSLVGVSGEDGALAIAAALKTNKSVKWLELRGKLLLC